MVAPEHRRRGYGRKVLTHALEVARSQGAERAILHVLEDNYPAKGLYESEGFVRFERVVHFKHEPPEGEELALPSGYELRRIGPFDRRASRVIHVAREPSSAEVYGVPETPPWYLQALARIQPGVRERYAVVHEGEWVGIYSFNAQFREKGAASAGISLVREHRGVGLEEALLSLALRRAREVGCPRLLTKADERNTPLLSACKALGFTQLYVMEGMYRGL
jgi:ribosomal protein S18 acetylase RimI-like enzyme